eukprot:6201092-Pleurochrysis_carterae.AAC.1
MPSPQQSARSSEADAHTFRQQPATPRKMLRKAHSRKASLSRFPPGMTDSSRLSPASRGSISIGTRLSRSQGAAEITGGTAVARVRQG